MHNKEDVGIGLLTKMISISFKKSLDYNADRMELTASQCHVMGFLKRLSDDGKDVYLVDLERELRMSKPTLSGIIRRLEEKGFIEFVADEEDKRRKKIVRTERCYEVDEKMTENYMRIEGVLVEGIPENELDITKKVLNKMNNNLRTYNETHGKVV